MKDVRILLVIKTSSILMKIYIWKYYGNKFAKVGKNIVIIFKGIKYRSGEL
jgi:hypothetical protein